MMGQQLRTQSLFYYFRLEDQIPEDHLLRLIDRHVDLSFVRERLRSFYSSTGRPSIDPEVLLRLLLVGCLYGITSERRLLDEARMHLAYRWFTRLSLIKRFRIIPRFRRIGMADSGSPMYSGRYLRRSCGVVWRWASLKGGIWQWMERLWEPMPASKAEFHGSDSRKQRRFRELSGST
jgi:hypothetical protein